MGQPACTPFTLCRAPDKPDWPPGSWLIKSSDAGHPAVCVVVYAEKPYALTRAESTGRLLVGGANNLESLYEALSLCEDIVAKVAQGYGSQCDSSEARIALRKTQDALNRASSEVP